ncbi:hypothetical protein AYI69_g5974 [Smittium culicis]|uniref:Uncharacterized protein n=1 Tax=Smittium culicis TaxID=133412 RepID=A0A1R1Y287_9FUNG|nr:hypothetical protein AYI69_g5974 [Smittium culicis]
MRALLSDVAATVTQQADPTRRVSHQTADGPKGDRRSHFQETSSEATACPALASSNRAQTTRILTAVTLLRRRAPVLQLLLNPVQVTKPPTASQIFAEGVVAAGGGLNRDTERLPSLGPPKLLERGFRIPLKNTHSLAPGSRSSKGKSPSDVDSPATQTPYTPPTPMAQESHPVDDEIMDVDGHFDYPCH